MNTIERIEYLMSIRKMTPAQVARAAKINKATLSNILNGRRVNPSSRTLEGVAQALRTTLDYLLLKTDNPEPVNGEPPPDFGPDVMEAMRRLSRARNYELLIIARSFLHFQREINAVSRQELGEQFLDVGDMVVGEEDVDDLIRRRLFPLKDDGEPMDSDSSVDSSGPESDHAESPDKDDA